MTNMKKQLMTRNQNTKGTDTCQEPARSLVLQMPCDGGGADMVRHEVDLFGAFLHLTRLFRSLAFF